MNKFILPEHLQHSLTINTKALLQWLFLSVIVGVVVGAAGCLFFVCLGYVTSLRLSHPWLLYLLPIAGLLIVLLYNRCGMEDDKGTETVIASVRSGALLRLWMAPLIFLTTILTHLTGGSAGREGAALQLGGSISAYIGRILKLDDRDQRIMIMCGMATGFSALFGTPLAAAIFAMEVENVGVMYYAAFVPCLLGALTARQMAAMWGIMPAHFNVLGIPETPTPANTISLIALGILCGILANLFCRLLEFCKHMYQSHIKNPNYRILTGAFIVIALTLLLGTRDYNGAGIHVIVKAIQGTTDTWAFFFKMLFTALTLTAGFKGGEIVPSFFVGATFGCMFGPYIGLSPSFAAAVGLVCVFCGVTNAPMTSILLSYELFGGQGLVMMSMAIAISFTTSGYHSLFHQQKIAYSKIKPEYINVFSDSNTEE